jgi:hypothetical protein
MALAVLSPVLSAQGGNGTHVSVTNGDTKRKYSFAVVGKDGSMSCWGSWETDGFKDLKGKEDSIYVKQGHEMYRITDAGILIQAKKAIEPLTALGKQQGLLGREQGKLGTEQGKLGARQGEYGRQMGRLTRDLHSTNRDRDSSKFELKMKDLSAQMQALGKQQALLGERQKALGARQSELGKRQSEAAKDAEAKIVRLIDDAFARGLAKRA